MTLAAFSFILVPLYEVSLHDLHATMLHLLGFDHEKFSFPF